MRAVRCGLTSEKLSAGGSSAASQLCEHGEIGWSGEISQTLVDVVSEHPWSGTVLDGTFVPSLLCPRSTNRR